MRHLLATIGLGPILLAQGRWARRRTPRLPEAPGPRHGVAGDGTLLSILVAGDSAAAGVGAPHQEQALAGQLVQQLSQSHRTHWTLEARTGATTSTTLRRMSRLGDVTFDNVVTSLGVNDVLAGLSLRAWRDSQGRLRELLRESFGGPRLIVCGLPPVSGFPALPQPLRWYLGRRSKEFDRVLGQDLESEPDATYLPLDFATDASLMADDGFHPGPEIYRQWARQVAAVIRGSAASASTS